MSIRSKSNLKNEDTIKSTEKSIQFFVIHRGGHGAADHDDDLEHRKYGIQLYQRNI